MTASQWLGVQERPFTVPAMSAAASLPQASPHHAEELDSMFMRTDWIILTEFGSSSYS